MASENEEQNRQTDHKGTSCGKPSGADARLAYKVAVDLWAYQGQELWNRSNALILAQSILLGGSFVAEHMSDVARASLSVAGVAFGFLWLALIGRGFGYMDHFVRSARKLERQIPGIRTAQGGASIPFEGFAALKARYAVTLIAWVFIFIHVAVLVVTGFKLYTGLAS